MATHNEIMTHWPTIKAFAEDLDIPYETIMKWRQRRRIPPKHWSAIVYAAKYRGYPIDFSDLAAAA